MGAIVYPRPDEDREAALERRCRQLEDRVAEQALVLTDSIEALNAEIARHEATRQELLKTQRLESLRQSMAHFLHESKNNLYAIQASFEMLARETTNASHHEIIAAAQSAVQAIARCNNRFLSNFRPADSSVETIDPRIWLPRFADFSRLIVGHCIEVTVHVDQHLQGIDVDAAALQSALMNLILNACDSMPQGGRLHLSAHSLTTSNPTESHGLPLHFIVFGVRDNGTGMSDDVLARAGEPFFTSKGKGRGTGLGLAAANEFAARAQGWLRIDSALGAGTLVEIHLPSRNRLTADTSTPTHRQHAKRHLFLVGPASTVRTQTSRMLRDLGYTVFEAASVNAAVALAFQLPALHLAIVSDRIDDLTALVARLRVERPQLPCLVLGKNQNGTTPAGLHYLAAPFDSADLARTVAACLTDQAQLDGAEELLTQLMLRRLRTAILRESLQTWRALRGFDALPHIAAAELLIRAHRDHHFLASVDNSASPPRFRRLSFGTHLTASLGRSLADQHFDGGAVESMGSLATAYSTAARSRLPVYDWIRYRLNDGSTTFFQRLILPLSEDGYTLTHLLGFVVIEGDSHDRPA